MGERIRVATYNLYLGADLEMLLLDGSPVGPGGFTGCLTQVIEQARRESSESIREGTAPEE